MVRIERHPDFKKAYRARIARQAKLVARVAERLQLFVENPHHPLLRDHPLVGSKRDLRAFSVTGDIRIVYMWRSADVVLLLDIGSHNQVY